MRERIIYVREKTHETYRPPSYQRRLPPPKKEEEFGCLSAIAGLIAWVVFIVVFIVVFRAVFC